MPLYAVDAFGPAPVGLDWQRVDVVLAYLTPRGMKRIARDLWPRLRAGARVISVQFALPESQEGGADPRPHRVETSAYRDQRGEQMEFIFFEYVVAA